MPLVDGKRPNWYRMRSYYTVLGTGMRVDAGKIEFKLTKTTPGGRSIDKTIQIAPDEYGALLLLLETATLSTFRISKNAKRSLRDLEQFIRRHRMSSRPVQLIDGDAWERGLPAWMQT